MPSPQQLFDKSVEQLSKKQAEDALASMREVQSQGFTSADLESNMGQALMAQGKTGEAILHFQNAVRLDRFDQDFRTNLRLAQQKVEGALGTKTQHPMEWGNTVLSFLRPSEGFSIALFFLFIFVGTKLLPSVKRGTRFCFFGLALVFAALGVGAQLGSRVSMLANDAELKSAPLTSAEATHSLKSGTRLVVLRQSGDFSEVERPNSFRGWIESKALTESF